MAARKTAGANADMLERYIEGARIVGGPRLSELSHDEAEGFINSLSGEDAWRLYQVSWPYAVGGGDRFDRIAEKAAQWHLSGRLLKKFAEAETPHPDTLAQREMSVETDVREIRADVKTITQKGARRWDAMIDRVLYVLIGAAISLAMAGGGAL